MRILLRSSKSLTCDADIHYPKKRIENCYDKFQMPLNSKINAYSGYILFIAEVLQNLVGKRNCKLGIIKVTVILISFMF